MKFTGLLAAIGMGLLSSASLAADLPIRKAPPVFDPPPPPPLSWTGPFFGAYGALNTRPGGNSISGKNLITTEDVQNYPGLLSGGSFLTMGSRPGSGRAGGGAQVGYDHSLNGSFLVGVVMDVTFLGRESETNVSRGFVWTRPWMQTASFSDSFQQSWVGTARLRAGLTFDRLLIFASGGLAFGPLDSSANSRTVGYVPGVAASERLIAAGGGSTSGLTFGYAVGAGAEFRLSRNLSLVAEYVHYSLKKTYGVTVTPAQGTGGAPVNYDVEADGSGNLIKLGLNFRF